MPIDEMTLRRLFQARPELASLLRQPTVGGFMPESVTRPPEPAESGFGGGLWNRVKGFFEPDGEDDQDLSSAGWAGAAQAAAAASANPQLSPIQILTQSLAGYSGARERARAGLRGEAQKERILGLQERGLEAEATDREAKAASRQQLMEQIAAIEDPMQRRAAMLNPEAYGTQLAEQAFPEKEKLIPVNKGLFDPNTGEFVVAPPPPDPVSLSEGGALIDPLTGREIASRAKTYAPQAQYELEGGVRLNRFTGAIEKIPGAAKLPPIGELQAYRDSLPPGQARDEVQAQIDKLNAAGGGDTELTKLYDAMDAERDPTRKAAYQAKINSILKGRGGVRFTTAAGDTFEMGGEDGGGMAMDLSQPNLNKVQESVVNAQEQLGRLGQIESSVKPEYLGYGPRIGAFITSEAEKLGLDPSEASKKQLADITTFRANVINNLNTQIKEQSGLSMTEGETKRTQLETPNESDSATEFSAKVNALTKRLKNTIIRKQLLLMQGIQFDPKSPTAPGGIEIDNVPKAINDMGNQIEQSLIAAGVPAAAARAQAKQQLKQKLGL